MTKQTVGGSAGALQLSKGTSYNNTTTRSTIFFPITKILVATIVAAIVVARPYKKQYDLYNKLDIDVIHSIYSWL